MLRELYGGRSRVYVAVRLLVVGMAMACATDVSADASVACRAASKMFIRDPADFASATTLRECPQQIAEAVVPAWRQPRADSAGLAALIQASTGPLHPGILKAAMRIAEDTQTRPNVRAVAMVVMGRYLNGSMTALLSYGPDEFRWPHPFVPSDGGPDPTFTTEYQNQRAAIIDILTRAQRADTSRYLRFIAERVLFDTRAPQSNALSK